jgi:hypothetical protein
MQIRDSVNATCCVAERIASGIRACIKRGKPIARRKYSPSFVASVPVLFYHSPQGTAGVMHKVPTASLSDDARVGLCPREVPA